uniref:Uncharacterized protein n=1 Tax=Steinernema glaseri TaxID=37863 RepID=A0A1I8AH92_9BILA
MGDGDSNPLEHTRFVAGIYSQDRRKRNEKPNAPCYEELNGGEVGLQGQLIKDGCDVFFSAFEVPITTSYHDGLFLLVNR